MHEILVKNGTLIDGTGHPRRSADVGIDGPRIAGVYEPGTASGTMVLDVTGMIVCPGFVDIHTHSDIHVLGCPLAESKIRQGVTTELVGNCGGSAAPLLGSAVGIYEEYAKEVDVEVTWRTMDEYLLKLADTRSSVNIATLVGADTLRSGVIGLKDRPPSAQEQEDMNDLLAEAMTQGAYGVSSGLIYAPGCYAATPELVSLARVAARLGGFYSSHIRGEGKTLLSAVQEAITIGAEAGCRVQISHHKAIGPRNWSLVDKTLVMIDAARSKGVDVAFDVYPYTASSTSLDSILPPWARDGGKKAILARLRDSDTRERIKQEFLDLEATDWENTIAEDGWDRIVLNGLKKPENKQFENRTVQDLASGLGKKPEDAALDLLLEEDLGVMAIFHEISEDDVKKVLSHPLACVGSDGEIEAPYGPTSDAQTHPRSYGTFPRVLRRYSLDMGLFSLEEAIRKMTAWPAERIGLRDRGVIAPRMAADVVVFDPKRVRDMATFEDSHRYAEGIVHVLVNGLPTIQNGEHTKERAGQVLRHSVGKSG